MANLIFEKMNNSFSVHSFEIHIFPFVECFHLRIWQKWSTYKLFFVNGPLKTINKMWTYYSISSDNGRPFNNNVRWFSINVSFSFFFFYKFLWCSVVCVSRCYFRVYVQQSNSLWIFLFPHLLLLWHNTVFNNWILICSTFFNFYFQKRLRDLTFLMDYHIHCRSEYTTCIALGFWVPKKYK
jgi:hypothetical protein